MTLPFHPFWIGYLIICSTLYILYTLIESMDAANSPRVSLYNFWLPLSLCMAAAGWLLAETIPLLSIFKI